MHQSARVKKEIADKPGWEIIDNVYLNVLSFTNYLMWHDVRYNIDKFKESPLIRSMISNSVDAGLKNETPTDTANSDEAYFGTDRMLLPISADSSQYQAIKASLNGSFVLHGPPGTGKSQTITNIIVNNIVRGRRVLFVAEKMAALNVVYKRLVDCGAGDFCLELHSDKTHKTDILSKIINTLNLGSADIKKALNRGELDAAIAVRLDELEAFNQTSLYYEQFIAYVAETDPLFNNKNIKTSDLGNEFLWLLDEGHCFRDQLVKFCDLKSATESKSKYSLGSIETFMRMVENGQGVTFIPELALSQLSDKQMRLVRPFALPIPVRDVVLLTTKTFVRHSMAELIIKSVKDNVPQSMLTRSIRSRLQGILFFL